MASDESIVGSEDWYQNCGYKGVDWVFWIMIPALKKICTQLVPDKIKFMRWTVNYICGGVCESVFENALF